MEENNTFTAYDEIMQTKELQMLKTMVPYFPPLQQKQIAITINFLELKNTLDFFSSSQKGLVSCEIPQGSDQKSALLSSLRQFCSPKEQETIDMLMNLFQIMDNYDSFFNFQT